MLYAAFPGGLDALHQHMYTSPFALCCAEIDAQGEDVPMLRTAPPSLLRRRVERIEFESIGRHCAPLYIGQPTCDEAARYLTAHGFRALLTARGDPCMGMTNNPFAARTSLYGYGCEATMRYENLALLGATRGASQRARTMGNTTVGVSS